MPSFSLRLFFWPPSTPTPPKRDALDGSAGVPLLLGAPTKRRAEEGKRNAGRLRETHAPKNQPSPALPCRSPGPVVSPCLLLTSLFRHSSRKNVYFYAVHAGAVPPLQSPGLQSFLAKKNLRSEVPGCRQGCWHCLLAILGCWGVDPLGDVGAGHLWEIGCSPELSLGLELVV